MDPETNTQDTSAENTEGQVPAAPATEEQMPTEATPAEGTETPSPEAPAVEGDAAAM